MKRILLFLFCTMAINGAIGYSQTTDLNYMVQAHYDFSGDASDISGNDHDGTTFGSPTLTTDRFGNVDAAYEFDGDDDLINTFSTFDYPNRTLSLWINPYDISGLETEINVAITQDNNALDYGVLRVEFNDNGMKLWAGGITGTYSDSDISTNSWIHLILIREENISKYYVDNVLVHTSTADDTGSTFNPISDFIIGSGRATTNQFFKGKIDDIRIYNRAINEDEIEDLYNETSETLAISTIESLPSQSINIFPNPTSNDVSVTFNSTIKPWKLEVIDGAGKLLKTISAQDNDFKISMADCISGLYYIRVFYDNEVIVKKLIKK